MATTCDIYRAGNAPPTAPDVAAVKITLTSAYMSGQTSFTAIGKVFTHTAVVPFATDVRDGHTGSNAFLAQDTIYVPNKDGTPFIVRFTEIIGRDTPQQEKRLYLDRQTPTWPTNSL